MFAAFSRAGGRFCRRVSRLRGGRRQGFTFLIGAAAGLALPPFYLLPLCFFSFSMLVILLDSAAEKPAGTQPALSAARRRRKYNKYKAAALTGWFFGFGYFISGLWWLAAAMTVDLAQFGWAIPFAVFGLPAFLALYYALAACLAMAFWQSGILRLLALAAAFAAAEYLRGLLFTGFPWNAIGLTAMPCPLLMQADAVLGPNGMNALAVFVYSLPALWRRSSHYSAAKQARLALCLLPALIAADCLFGAYRLTRAPALTQAEQLSPMLPAGQAETAAAAAPFRVRLIQPAIAQTEKQSPQAQQANFARLLRLSAAAPKDGGRPPNLIIWPETSVPYLLDYNQAALAQISHTLRPGQLALVGAVRVEETEPPSGEDSAENAAGRYRFFNSMLLIDADDHILDYADKQHLVPFGEYLPLAKELDYLHLKALAAAAGPYSAAKQRRYITLPNGITLLPLICYEAIFPQESRPLKAADGSGRQADILVNITNDAWFGNTPGPRQHLAQARLRAVEQGRPLLRAANNGISAYSDSYGRIRAALPLNAAGFLDIDFTVKPQARP